MSEVQITEAQTLTMQELLRAEFSYGVGEIDDTEYDRVQNQVDGIFSAEELGRLTDHFVVNHYSSDDMGDAAGDEDEVRKLVAVALGL